MVEDSVSAGRSNGLVYLVLVILLALFIFSLVVFVYKFGSLGFVDKVTGGDVVVRDLDCRFGFRAFDVYSQGWVLSDYLIKQGSRTVKQGSLEVGVREEFGGFLSKDEVLQGLSNFTVYAFDDDGVGSDFYGGFVNCSCGEECVIDVTKEGVVSVVANRVVDGFDYSVSVDGGVLNPFLVCFRRSFGVVDVYALNTSVVNVSLASIPSRFVGVVDDCYSVNSSLKDSGLVFPVMVVKDEFSEDCKVRSILVDGVFNRFFEFGFDDYGVEDLEYEWDC